MENVQRISLDITDKCNLQCKHCYKGALDEITELSIRDIICFLEEMGVNNGGIRNIIISGGEPLLFENLIKLLYALNGKCNIRLNTNGVLLSEYIKQFEKMEKFRIQVSLDGYDEDTYFQIRNSYKFYQIIENAIKAKKAGLNVIFRATLTNITINNYIEFVKLSKKYEIPIIIQPMLATGQPFQNEIKLTYDKLLNWYENVEKKGLNNYVGENLLLGDTVCSLLRDTPTMDHMVISAEGNIYTCAILKDKQFCIGNIYMDNLSTIKRRFKVVATNLKEMLHTGICKSCEINKDVEKRTCIALCSFCKASKKKQFIKVNKGV